MTWVILLPLIVSGAMTDAAQQRAVRLETVHEGDSVRVIVVAEPQQTQTIDYTLVMEGSSSSRHRSKSTVVGGQRSDISKMTMTVGENWCARLTVIEEDGTQYELTSGPCQ